MPFDWSTFALEAINFLILVWLLQHFLYRPVLAAIDGRREENAAILARAEGVRREAEGLRTAVEQERRDLAAQRDSLLEQARSAAEAERQRLVAEARREAAAAREEGQRLLAHERQEAEVVLRRRVAHISVDLASRLLAVTTNHHATDAFLDRACEALGCLPEAERRALVGPDEGMRVRIVSAEALDEGRRQQCRARLVDLLGREPEVEFADDSSLIAGVEVHFPHAVLRHNWRVALDEALADMEAAAEPRRSEGRVGQSGSEGDEHARHRA